MLCELAWVSAELAAAAQLLGGDDGCDFRTIRQGGAGRQDRLTHHEFIDWVRRRQTPAGALSAYAWVVGQRLEADCEQLVQSQRGAGRTRRAPTQTICDRLWMV